LAEGAGKKTPAFPPYALTLANRPLHLQVARQTGPQTKIITLYEPDPAEWVSLIERRK